MTRDETIALFLECEAKRAEARAAATHEGKREYEADEVAHEAAKAHWNAWAEGMLAKRKALEQSGQWPSEAGSWMEELKVDFSRCVFFFKRINGTIEAREEKKDGQAGILPLTSITIEGRCADLRDFVFPGTASFDCATFKGNAKFDNATLENAGFDSATFQGFVSFDSATFQGSVSFTKTTFKGHAGFRAATFQGDPTLQPNDLINDIFGAWFGSATFEGDAWFDSAKFLRDAKFESATFLDRASFANAIFQGRALFRAQTFPKDVFFDKAKFGPGRADFGLATFERVATFDGAEFKGEANFNAVAGKRTFSMAGARIRARSGFHPSPFRGSAASRQCAGRATARIGTLNKARSVGFVRALAGAKAPRNPSA